MKQSVTLLIPEKTDTEFEAVFATWTNNGGIIRRLGKYWIKDETLAGTPLAIYGNQTFSMVLAQIYNVDLLSPDDAFIARIDRKWTCRTIELRQIGQVQERDFPIFIKSVIPKLFIAGVFQNPESFKDVTRGLQDTEEILTSTIVDPISAEARCFIMNGEVKDIALYEGSADIMSGREFVGRFMAAHKDGLPHIVVVDIAYNADLGWFVLEFNACWGAGLNNCNAENVIECIIEATVNR